MSGQKFSATSSPHTPPQSHYVKAYSTSACFNQALHYELEQISKSEILRKLKQRFGGKTIRDVRFRVG
jgi:hypothetical protein